MLGKIKKHDVQCVCCGAKKTILLERRRIRGGYRILSAWAFWDFKYADTEYWECPECLVSGNEPTLYDMVCKPCECYVEGEGCECECEKRGASGRD